jgi:hypothetical protein
VNAVSVVVTATVLGERAVAVLELCKYASIDAVRDVIAVGVAA